MESNNIISEINLYLHEAAILAADWLTPRLKRLDPTNWWESAVLNKLSTLQYNTIQDNQITKIEELDLAALLRVMRNNWYALSGQEWLTYEAKDSVYKMQKVRITWAHIPSVLPEKKAIQADIETCVSFFSNFGASENLIARAKDFIQRVSLDSFEDSIRIPEREIPQKSTPEKPKTPSNDFGFAIGDIVSLRSDTSRVGVIIACSSVGKNAQFTVFMENSPQFFYENQLQRAAIDSPTDWISIKKLRDSITIQQLRNPASEHLYSLNSARVDFVPYQFRPALKLIKADRPRILVADSVGVGKTIEAGLLLRELQARNEDFESVLIICPKPLVAEHKWKSEMKRFDESFTELDGAQLRLAMKDCNLDGEWPQMHRKTIVPFSLLNDELVNGKKGLYSLNPPVKFDLVIIDEAHHVRHSDTQAYKAVKYFCDNATAVVMLTATPIQTSEDDLFTLLNLLRPDVVLDKKTYEMMTEPNHAINAAVKILRNAPLHWREDAAHYLEQAANTNWGKNVLIKNPIYTRVIGLLNGEGEITRELRVGILRDVESLHSFASMINRTRRQDIQDFCIRRTVTLESHFSEEQQCLYDALMEFESKSLKHLHPGTPLEFMMNMLMRQASSCIFGLAPMVDNILSRRLEDLAIDYGEDDYDIDILNRGLDLTSVEMDFREMATKVKYLSENLSENDEKLDCLISALQEKQLQENNKVIIFSAFRHTLNYIESHLKAKGFRVAQVNGSVKDEQRVQLRSYFEREKDNPEALDILLFTEVGCEGLDYQFCNMMINYDLPWNPMAIEQRIGRIDRRGQLSDTVTICNIITVGTIDAKVYSRCLSRIGIFESSIGECSSILGNITNEIHDIVFDPTLTPEEREYKLEKMADNEVSKMQEMKRLESEQRELFGFDLSSYMMDQAVADAENPWISPRCIESVTNNYLNDELGEGSYILGEKGQKSLRLSKENRSLIFESFKKAHMKRSASTEQWRKYLRGTDAIIPITFDQVVAEKNRNSLFINPVHPLVKLAVSNFSVEYPMYSCISVHQSDVGMNVGKYPYLIVQWIYTGVKNQTKLVLVSDSAISMADYFDVLDAAICEKADVKDYQAKWDSLETLVHSKWKSALETHKQQNQELCDFRKTAYQKSYESRLASLSSQLESTKDEKLKRMRTSQIAHLSDEKEQKMEEFSKMLASADIQTTTLVKGVLIVQE